MIIKTIVNESSSEKAINFINKICKMDDNSMVYIDVEEQRTLRYILRSKKYVFTLLNVEENILTLLVEIDQDKNIISIPICNIKSIATLDVNTLEAK